ncbi:GNAT family N-acetyltransferase [Variovorax sp. UC122_21]|uniref:GNAT family N-acetyltransferase n=1 Tax=Variovorax sp. UC122_21 TaxID=3374554 RepID=UPI00375768DA
MTIAPESPNQPEVIALIAELDAYQDTLYPPESRHLLDLASLKRSNVLFFVARDDTRRAIGCGAVVLGAAQGEIKRMYVAPDYRGRGIARKLLQGAGVRSHRRGLQAAPARNGSLPARSHRPLRRARLRAARSLRQLHRRPAQRLHAEDALRVDAQARSHRSRLYRVAVVAPASAQHLGTSVRAPAFLRCQLTQQPGVET